MSVFRCRVRRAGANHQRAAQSRARRRSGTSEVGGRGVEHGVDRREWNSTRFGLNGLRNVTDYGRALYLAAEVGYPGGSCRIAVSRCCRNLRRMTVQQGLCSASRASECECQEHRCVSRLASICSGGTKEGLHLMTYCTASAPPRPASRTFAAIATMLVALAGMTVLCVPLTVAVSLAVGSCLLYTSRCV